MGLADIMVQKQLEVPITPRVPVEVLETVIRRELEQLRSLHPSGVELQNSLLEHILTELKTVNSYLHGMNQHLARIR